MWGINDWEDRPDISKNIDEWRSQIQQEPGTSYKYNDMSNNEPKCKIVTALNLSQYEPKQQINAYILA